MAPYLTATQAATRLSSRFGITATLTDGDMDVASDELDGSGPFIGTKKEDAQERSFPRSVNPDGSENTASTPPDRVLDATALLAYYLTQDEGPAITSESVIDRSITYAVPKETLTLSRVRALLRPYQLKAGTRL